MLWKVCAVLRLVPRAGDVSRGVACPHPPTLTCDNPAHMPFSVCFFFFFNDTATTEIYTLSLHDALPILALLLATRWIISKTRRMRPEVPRSEEHTSELQSRLHLVCRLLLEKKKNKA